jgi:nucleotidyltransferase substrate binding protein (TIGR01987 family)
MNIKHYEFYYKIRTLPFVEEISLFGSRAQGKESERSDIDLAIKCPEATENDWRDIRTIIDKSDTLLKIDCVRLDDLNDERLLREIEKTKVVLFKRVKNNYPWYEIFLDLGEALEKFSSSISPENKKLPFSTEATIHIFEYTFELYWKLLKKICAMDGMEANSPRSALQQSYAIKLIDNEKIWLDMLEDRNLTSHTYKPPAANIIRENCKVYCQTMQSNYDKLRAKFKL